ncbi:MAG: hypothetical protein HRT89_06395 [Lentisphaeria bacterium]|nr:hypothetical protein [Lentisphaeria bacterium]NQZ67682.1 hypothetical protein [Lentisphaeria bacterium]
MRNMIQTGMLEELIDSINPHIVEDIWCEPFNDRQNWKIVQSGYKKDSKEYEWFSQAFGELKDISYWSGYTTEIYTRIISKGRSENWAEKVKFLLYEKNITEEDAVKFGNLEGVLLQSKPRPDGLSKNSFIRSQQTNQGSSIEKVVNIFSQNHKRKNKMNKNEKLQMERNQMFETFIQEAILDFMFGDAENDIGLDEILSNYRLVGIINGFIHLYGENKNEIRNAYMKMSNEYLDILREISQSKGLEFNNDTDLNVLYQQIINKSSIEKVVNIFSHINDLEPEFAFDAIASEEESAYLEFVGLLDDKNMNITENKEMEILETIFTLMDCDIKTPYDITDETSLYICLEKNNKSVTNIFRYLPYIDKVCTIFTIDITEDAIVIKFNIDDHEISALSSWLLILAIRFKYIEDHHSSMIDLLHKNDLIPDVA